MALTESSGDILAFCDADCVPEPGWLEHGIAALESADLVAGRIRFISPARRTVWTLIDMDTSKNQKALAARGLAETANLFIRRELFDRFDGFDTSDNGYGDYELVQALCRVGL